MYRARFVYVLFFLHKYPTPDFGNSYMYLVYLLHLPVCQVMAALLRSRPLSHASDPNAQVF